jgi:NAD(P)-dependent dehydrogenase (short-subunit alcohol dehydrogenase family)
LDALLNNAGVGFGGPLAELPDEHMYRQFKVNVFGVFRVTKAFFPLLLENHGRIVIMGSTSGFFTALFAGPYSMSKRSLEGYADAPRRELDPLGMKVIIVDPANVKTPLWDKVERMFAELGPDSSPLFRDRAIRIIQTGIERARHQGFLPIDVAKTVYRALHSEKPKGRHAVNRHPFIAYLSTHLPAAVVDDLFRKM